MHQVQQESNRQKEAGHKVHTADKVSSIMQGDPSRHSRRQLLLPAKRGLFDAVRSHILTPCRFLISDGIRMSAAAATAEQHELGNPALFGQVSENFFQLLYGPPLAQSEGVTTRFSASLARTGILQDI